MPADGPSIGSFILTADRPAALRATIGAVLGQTRVPDAVLVVDIRADPETRRVVESLGVDRVELVTPGADLGPAGGYAYGMRSLHRRGFDWIHGIHDEDPPRTDDTIERLLALVGRHDGRLGAVGAAGSRWDWRTGECRRVPDDSLRGDVPVDVIGRSQLTVRREVVDEVGTPDPELFAGYDDTLYCLRLAKAGYRLFVDGELMYRYRQHAGRLRRQPTRALVPVEDADGIWWRYYTTRNYVHAMRQTFERPDLARRETAKAVARSALAWTRGGGYGARYTRLQLQGVVDGYRGRLGRVVEPVDTVDDGDGGPLRVLQVVTAPQRRGAEVFARQLNAELANRGCVVRTAYLYRYDGDDALALSHDDTVLGTRADHVFETVPGLHPGIVRRLRRTISEFRPDIVQVNGSRSVKYGALARAMDRSGWALVYRNIGEPQVWVRTPPHRFVYRHLVMPRADGMVAVGGAMVERIRSFYATTAPVVRIPNAVDVARFLPQRARTDVRAELGVDAGAPVVLYVGSLAPEKRPDRLLRVFEEVHRLEREAQLWVVGDGPLRAVVDAATRPNGAPAAVRALGVRSDVTDLMYAADVLLLVSDTEGVPGVVLEAGAASLPTVATRVGGLSECVLDGVTGLLVEPDDEAGMAKAVLTLLHDDMARKRMGVEARRWVAKEFSLDVVAREYAAFYRRVLAERRARIVAEP